MRDAVLVPVHDEEDTVQRVLDAVARHHTGDVIVVDDGSVDATPQILAMIPGITVVRLDQNCGYGCALRIGFDVARELGVDRLITMDCDGQHEPAHIPQFFSALTPGVDIVSGSRYLPDSGLIGQDPPFDRQRINAKVTAMIDEHTGWSLTDSFCGFKAYRMDALGCIRLTVPGYGMPLELWAKAWRCGLNVIELPVERIYLTQDRSFGASLDDPEARYAYYEEVWRRALEEA